MQLVGKSTLINSLRELHDVEAIVEQPYDIFGPALTGEIETTRETQCYGYPDGSDLEFVRFWDHPGCGTQSQSATNYFERNVLYAYDCVLMITSGSLGEYERGIIEAARKYNTAIVIVVNKADDRVRSKIRRRAPAAGPLNENARTRIIQETIDEAKTNIRQALQNIQQDSVPIFVVSAEKWRCFLETRNPEDMELALEIQPLMECLIHAALDRRRQL